VLDQVWTKQCKCAATMTEHGTTVLERNLPFKTKFCRRRTSEVLSRQWNWPVFPSTCLFFYINRKKSQGAMSGEYEGLGIVTVLFLAKKSRTSNEVWAGALSWCKSHELFLHKSGRFFGLLHANGVELVGSTPYWSFNLVARIRDALCH